jgi:hypothetical protein
MVSGDGGPEGDPGHRQAYSHGHKVDFFYLSSLVYNRLNFKYLEI